MLGGIAGVAFGTLIAAIYGQFWRDGWQYRVLAFLGALNVIVGAVAILLDIRVA